MYGHRLLIYKATSRGAMELTKSISPSLLLYNAHVGLAHRFLRLRLGDLSSKSLELFCFMDFKAASMICPLGTSSHKKLHCIYMNCYHWPPKWKFLANTRTC